MFAIRLQCSSRYVQKTLRIWHKVTRLLLLCPQVHGLGIDIQSLDFQWLICPMDTPELLCQMRHQQHENSWPATDEFRMSRTTLITTTDLQDEVLLKSEALLWNENKRRSVKKRIQLLLTSSYWISPSVFFVWIWLYSPNWINFSNGFEIIFSHDFQRMA